MVVLEAAAITAGGVAAFKGGQVAVRETSKKIKAKLKLSSQEKQRKETYNSRKEERKERFAQINQYRETMKKADSKTEGVLLPKFDWGKSEEGRGARGQADSNGSRSITVPRKQGSSSSSKFW
mmetsp:Transcript_20555/g.43164  ORF Transcript_20555/g.43164 Transcript_20555/m.43164 type:complete len:123 (-) Transcript_20555:277-645(-)|eukprot:CAMPEP_0171327638 /NCGR_PEP_ID=MMETSP0878-20121228/150_1 /TAXON_ID=67004 /ORGANISM="Thalassiosira weissflogii, Strain CCMP1336" /LENGTH=122 /DNA_ID=CAMNT_0011827423 /DNA_START=140 /DNA_END=508 /DNA_ORIENTATION=+